MRKESPNDITAQLPLQLNHNSVSTSQEYAAIFSKEMNLSILREFSAILTTAVVLHDYFSYEHYHVAIVTLTIESEQDELTIRSAAQQYSLDVALLRNLPSLDDKGLLVMDMDSTAIEIECIDEIAKLAGTGEQVSAITEQAMRGELDFTQSLRKRVATLQHADEDILAQVRATLPLMPGLRKTIHTLKQHGWRTAIASGGFTYFADYLKKELELDEAVSNQLEIQEGKLTGNVIGDIVDAQYKANTLMALREKFHISPHHVIAIGDGANDLPMLRAAGVGIAYHAKPKVQQAAQIVINHSDFTAVLLLLKASQRLKIDKSNNIR